MKFLWEDFLTSGQDFLQQLDKCLPGLGETCSPDELQHRILVFFHEQDTCKKAVAREMCGPSQNGIRIVGVSTKAETQFWENMEIGTLNDRC